MTGRTPLGVFSLPLQSSGWAIKGNRSPEAGDKLVQCPFGGVHPVCTGCIWVRKGFSSWLSGPGPQKFGSSLCGGVCGPQTEIPRHHTQPMPAGSDIGAACPPSAREQLLRD